MGSQVSLKAIKFAIRSWAMWIGTLVRLDDWMDVYVRPKVSPANEASFTLRTFEWFIICLKMNDFKMVKFSIIFKKYIN